MKYNILLYYCYTTIEDPYVFREQHHFDCLELNLRGRIIIAPEGINGTLSGLVADTEKYMLQLKSDPRFSSIDFKVETHHQHAFQKLNVRVKPEIVHANLVNINPQERTGEYIEPKDLKKELADPNVVLLDVRSNYEHDLGKFKDAHTLQMENFREFPEIVKEISHLKKKKIITYCTGGIKCEKASAYLLEQGFENVYQLHGGIIKYGIEAGGEDFEGKCYVFDNRIAVDVNHVNPVVVSKCYCCGEVCDRMVNCANPECNLHMPLCRDCGITMEGACSNECKDNRAKRPYNGTGYYQKELNGYNPYRGIRRGQRFDP